ncbi:RNA-binding domain-containing protein [Stetteria hydrogenophila]
MPVRSVEARVFVHATEDKDKVLKALLEILPAELRQEVRVAEERLSGHYGNPITKLTLRVEGDAALRVVEYLFSKLSPADRGLLASSIEDRVDRHGTFYLRLSKQEAYQGRIYVYESDDVIRVSIHYSGRRSRALKDYEKLLSGQA